MVEEVDEAVRPLRRRPRIGDRDGRREIGFDALGQSVDGGGQSEALLAVSNEDADKLFPGYKTHKPYLRTTKQPQ